MTVSTALIAVDPTFLEAPLISTRSSIVAAGTTLGGYLIMAL